MKKLIVSLSIIVFSLVVIIFVQDVIMIEAVAGLSANSIKEEAKTMNDREKMVEQQIERRGIRDQDVLKAMREVKRHLFVPEERQKDAYADYPLPIGQGQTISQPYIVAYMTEALRLNQSDKVLEIGTGSGYQAAVLAKIVDQVYSIEIVDKLCQSSQVLLKSLGYNNISVRCGDGYQGWEEHAPYDAIIVTAAPPKIPEKLVDQLKIGGKMIVPVGSWNQELILISKTESEIQKKSLLPVRFVPMVEGK